MWPLHEALRAFCVPDVSLFPQWHEIEIFCCSVFSQLLGFLSLCNPKFLLYVDYFGAADTIWFILISVQPKILVR